MMYNYPFSSFPYFRRYSNGSSMYYQKPYSKNMVNNVAYGKNTYNSNTHNSNNYDTKSLNSKSSNSNNKNSDKKSSYGLSFLDNFFHQNDRSSDESYFDLFGLKLYNDDILLIGLIFFLYKEDVKDQYLFIALILLLLS